MTNLSQGYTDVFGKEIVDVTSNHIDIASHYPYNPERWRIFVDGSRQLKQYGSVSQYNHTGDRHELIPSGGEKVVLETAERPRYVVQYEVAYSCGLKINQSLNSGDHVRFGAWDGSEGWYIEHNGGHSSASDADLVVLRNGSKQTTKSDVDSKKSFQIFSRILLRTAWYDMTRQLWLRSYTSSGKQQNTEIGRTSLDSSAGPATGNLPLRFEVKAASGTSGLKAICGSVGMNVLGSNTGRARNKVLQKTINIDTTGSWVPLLAIRGRSNYDIVNNQISEFQVTEFGPTDDVQLLFQAHDSSKVKNSSGNALTDSDYSVPNEHNSENTSIEITEAVDQAADSSGTVTSSASNPGGWQIGYASLYTSGESNNSPRNATQKQQKRPLYGRDVGVVWAKAGSAGDVTFEITTEQDW